MQFFRRRVFILIVQHSKYRAEAMILRDDRSLENGVTEADWQKIHELLVLSWRSLWQAVSK